MFPRRKFLRNIVKIRDKEIQFKPDLAGVRSCRCEIPHRLEGLDAPRLDKADNVVDDWSEERGLSDLFRWPQEPFNPSALFAAEQPGGPVGPVQAEKRHARCVEQRGSLVEPVLAAMLADDRFALDLVRAGRMRRCGGIEQRFAFAE